MGGQWGNGLGVNQQENESSMRETSETEKQVETNH